MSTAVAVCPRCGDELAGGQEYCVECGLRLVASGSLGRAADPGRGWIRRALVGLAVACAGAAAAVVASGQGGNGTTTLMATGGFATIHATGTLPVPTQSSGKAVAGWPSGQSGWTIVLASYPQTSGRRPAVVTAREARAKGLAQVGVLDSSAYASLHPGYWIVFAGIYGSEAEATSALQPARGFARAASVRNIVP